MQTESGGGVPETAAFAQALDTLKREGSNVLLVGSDASDAHAAACGRLLGNVDDGRYRLFVDADGVGRSRVEPCRPPGTTVDDATTRVVDGSASPRSGGVESGTAEPDLPGALGSDVVEAVDAFDEDADGLDPAQLRVCVDSVAPLLADHDSRSVFRLLHVTTARIRQVHGMGHFHLPVARDHDAVRLLEPLFDAVVEVRSDEGGDEQRWHLRGRETTSDWLAI